MLIPASLMASGACSRDEPQPKFLPAIRMSPEETDAAKSGLTSIKQLFVSSDPSEILRYLAGIIRSVSMSLPNFQTFP